MFWSQPKPCENIIGRPAVRPEVLTLFLDAAVILATILPAWMGGLKSLWESAGVAHDTGTRTRSKVAEVVKRSAWKAVLHDLLRGEL